MHFKLLLCCLGLTLSCFTDLRAAGPSKNRNTLSVHAGYGHLGNGVNGLTNLSQSYRDKMSSGVSWDAAYFFRPHRYLGYGALYSGFSSSGSQEKSTDHVINHCFIPQIGLYIFPSGKVYMRLNTGMGVMTIRNNSTVYGKERIVKGTSVAWNLHGEVIVPVTSWLGLSLNGGFVMGDNETLTSRYHGESIKVYYPYDGNSLFMRYTISAGLTYMF